MSVQTGVVRRGFLILRQSKLAAPTPTRSGAELASEESRRGGERRRHDTWTAWFSSSGRVWIPPMPPWGGRGRGRARWGRGFKDGARSSLSEVDRCASRFASSSPTETLPRTRAGTFPSAAIVLPCDKPLHRQQIPLSVAGFLFFFFLRTQLYFNTHVNAEDEGAQWGAAEGRSRK